MKHILFVVTRSDDIGGVQIHVRDLALWFQKKNYKVTLLIGGNGQYLDLLNKSKIEYLICSSLKREINVFDDLKAIFEIKRIVYKLQPNLIHIHSPKARIIFSILKLLGLKEKIISTAHGWTFNSLSKFNQIYKILELISSYSLDQTITVCQKDKVQALKNKFAKNKLVCIHNGIFDLDKKSNNKFKCNNTIKLMMIGRFERQKDHKTLIEACAFLKEFNWHLNLIGKGPLENNIKKRVKELSLEERVSFQGWKKDVNTFLDDTDIFLLISNWEGFPISIIEAMRSSLPIIASDVGGISESVNHGTNGYLVKKGEVKLLVKYLKKIFKDKKLLKEFGAKSREIYLSKFNSEKMFKDLDRIYSKFIN